MPNGIHTDYESFMCLQHASPSIDFSAILSYVQKYEI